MPLNIPLKLNIREGTKTGAVIGDIHFPYHDPRTLRLVEQFLFQLQPDFVIYNGDLADFYQVSVFAKDPARVHMLESDVKMVRSLFRRHREAMPNTDMVFIAGTHEYRFQKFMWSSAPELSSLTELTIPELYRLDKHNIQYIPFEQGLLINGIFLVLHGDLVSIHASYTAKRMFEKHGGCGIMNHTHRGGSFYKRDRFGTWGWWENFCLCDLDPDWTRNPNWVQGFSLIHFTDHKRFYVEQIPIVDHKFMYGNEEWSGR